MDESPDGNVFDVDEPDFERRVVERSRELPVVVDFWADWCGPCKALSPALERAAAARAGKVELAKVDVDRNQALAARFGIRGIPAVKAFRGGRVSTEFVGALPPPKVEEFFDSLGPSEADELVEQARQLLARGEARQALELLEPAAGDFVADGLAARAELVLDGEEELLPAFQAWDDGDQRAVLEAMEEALGRSADEERRDRIRRLMVAIFTELGTDHPLAREHRRRLAAALS